MFLFAQMQPIEISGGPVVLWTVHILLLLIGSLIKAAILSGIIHVISIVIKKDRFAFLKVFPYVFIGFIIFGIINTVYCWVTG